MPDRRICGTAALVVALVSAAVLVGQARADGDPASDYLVGQKVFLPYDAKIPPADAQRLLATVDQAAKQGFPIRVALIWSDYDLGSITSLWGRPRVYARFLGEELTYYYKQRLLIVMPNGFGFNYPQHSPATAYAELALVPIAATPAGLVHAATSAVRQLAAADGIQLHAAATPAASRAQRNNDDRVVIVIAGLVAILLGGLFRAFIRRRAAARAPG